jgi:hypothetical protein
MGRPYTVRPIGNLNRPKAHVENGTAPGVRPTTLLAEADRPHPRFPLPTPCAPCGLIFAKSSSRSNLVSPHCTALLSLALAPCSQLPPNTCLALLLMSCRCSTPCIDKPTSSSSPQAPHAPLFPEQKPDHKLLAAKSRSH